MSTQQNRRTVVAPQYAALIVGLFAMVLASGTLRQLGVAHGEQLVYIWPFMLLTVIGYVWFAVQATAARRASHNHTRTLRTAD